MKYTLELLVNKPRVEVWKIFDNPENTKIWQPSLTEIETISGIQGQPGAVSRLSYMENGREFSLSERITERVELNCLVRVYENAFADNTIKNRFIEQGNDQTMWTMETEYRFKTLIMKILGPVLKKNYVARSQREMERFKELVEKE
jgi:hypothetical protein